MKHTIIIAALIASPAYADGPSAPRFDPEPAHAECRILWGLLPCNVDRGPGVYTPREEAAGQPMHGDHTGKDVSEDKPSEDTPDTDKPTTDKPSKDKPSKGNASANNGKGGNYDRTGHQDNGKGEGREKK